MTRISVLQADLTNGSRPINLQNKKRKLIQLKFINMDMHT